jgi:hypothetical protein
MKAQMWPLKLNSEIREDKHLFENLQLSDVEADRIKHVLCCYFVEHLETEEFTLFSLFREQSGRT